MMYWYGLKGAGGMRRKPQRGYLQSHLNTQQGICNTRTLGTKQRYWKKRTLMKRENRSVCYRKYCLQNNNNKLTKKTEVWWYRWKKRMKKTTKPKLPIKPQCVLFVKNMTTKAM
eukprot:PhF_6_TR1970/c0_g1_i1/m.3260